MRILVDKNIPNITVHELRALGHDVLDMNTLTHNHTLTLRCSIKIKRIKSKIKSKSKKSSAESARGGILTAGSWRENDGCWGRRLEEDATTARVRVFHAALH